MLFIWQYIFLNVYGMTIKLIICTFGEPLQFNYIFTNMGIIRSQTFLALHVVFVLLKMS